MQHWLENALNGRPTKNPPPTQPPFDVIGKLCAEAERWQKAIRSMQSAVDLPKILRARAFPKP